MRTSIEINRHLGHNACLGATTSILDSALVDREAHRVALEVYLVHIGGAYGDADCPLTRLAMRAQGADA